MKEVHIKTSTPPSLFYPDDPYYPSLDAGFDTDNVTLYIPVGSIDSYKKHYYWKKFDNIVEE